MSMESQNKPVPRQLQFQKTQQMDFDGIEVDACIQKQNGAQLIREIREFQALIIGNQQEFLLQNKNNKSQQWTFKWESESTMGSFRQKYSFKNPNIVTLQSEQENEIITIKFRTINDIVQLLSNSSLNVQDLLPQIQQDYEFLSLQFSGSETEIYLASDIKDPCLMKTIRIYQPLGNNTDSTQINLQQIIIEEISLFEKIRGKKCIVQPEELYISKEGFAVVYEEMPYGNLREYIENYKDISEQEAKFVIFQLLSALQSLQEEKIRLACIEPENILLKNISPIMIKLINVKIQSPQEKVKTDFVNCQFDGFQEHYLQERSGLIIQSDIFSIGCIFYQLLTGCELLIKSQIDLLSQSISNRDMETIQNDIGNKIERCKSITPFCKDILTTMTYVHQNQRLPLLECLNHPWFQTDNHILDLFNSNSQQQLQPIDHLDLGSFMVAPNYFENIDLLSDNAFGILNQNEKEKKNDDQSSQVDIHNLDTAQQLCQVDAQSEICQRNVKIYRSMRLDIPIPDIRYDGLKKQTPLQQDLVSQYVKHQKFVKKFETQHLTKGNDDYLDEEDFDEVNEESEIVNKLFVRTQISDINDYTRSLTQKNKKPIINQ